MSRSPTPSLPKQDIPPWLEEDISKLVSFSAWMLMPLVKNIFFEASWVPGYPGTMVRALFGRDQARPAGAPDAGEGRVKPNWPGPFSWHFF